MTIMVVMVELVDTLDCESRSLWVQIPLITFRVTIEIKSTIDDFISLSNKIKIRRSFTDVFSPMLMELLNSLSDNNSLNIVL